MDGTGDFLETYYAVCQNLYSFSEFGYISDRKTRNYRIPGSNEVSISPWKWKKDLFLSSRLEMVPNAHFTHNYCLKGDIFTVETF